MRDLKDIQLEYNQKPLNMSDLKRDAYDQLITWYDDAEDEAITYRNAAFLTTVSASGEPSLRTILIKEITPNGIIFFTDYRSQKAKELSVNPRYSLLFFWKELDRQIRISGAARRTSREQSELYFKTRSRESQISAFCSIQSSQVSKEELLKKTAEARENLDPIPCPEQWGGYILDFEKIEFWQGRPNRLHDRFLYQKMGGEWNIERLSP